jgi:hypothetical protein
LNSVLLPQPFAPRNKRNTESALDSSVLRIYVEKTLMPEGGILRQKR